MQQVVYRCAALHLEHLAGSGDPFESGSSRPLDFGHWSAHKLEALSGFELGHGEAVALGLALDSTYSHLAGLLGKIEWQRILTTLTNLGFALHVPQLEADSVLAGLNEFREHLGGRLTVTLIWDLGQSLEVHDLDPNLIRAAIEELRHRAAALKAVHPAVV
jgi:3-dehydroquinate synthase